MQLRLEAPICGLALMVAACGDFGGKTPVFTTGPAPSTQTGGDETSDGGTGSTTTATGSGSATDDPTDSSSVTTTSTPTDSTTGDPTASDGTGPGFILDPDMGGGIAMCDIWAQDCPDGEKCAPYPDDGGSGWNATRCVPVVPNPKQAGDSCTDLGERGEDDCDKAMLCGDVDPTTNTGVCIDFCQGSEASPTCSDPGTECTIANDGVLILCLPGCDPLLQDCPGDDLCVPQPSHAGFVCALDPVGGNYQLGEPCTCLNCCQAGLWCAPVEQVAGCLSSVACCAPFCDVTDPGASANCPGAGQGEECVPWFAAGTAPPGQEDIGAGPGWVHGRGLSSDVRTRLPSGVRIARSRSPSCGAIWPGRSTFLNSRPLRS